MNEPRTVIEKARAALGRALARQDPSEVNQALFLVRDVLPACASLAEAVALRNLCLEARAVARSIAREVDRQMRALERCR